MEPTKITPITILGIQVHPLTVAELHTYLGHIIDTHRKERILNVNVHCLNLAYTNPWLHNFLNQAEVVFCDGAGVIWGAKLLGHHIPERITYADWMWQLADFANQRDDTLFFLGAEPNIAAKAATAITQKYPTLRVVGTHHGFFDKTQASIENQAVIQKINSLKPNILVLGFGMPRQEQWLMENWQQLDVNIALTGGAVFDYLSGNLKRAPRWMNDNSMEWLGRFLIEPKRLWQRYLIGNPLFFWRILRQKYGK